MSDIVEELRSRTTGIVLLSDPPQFQKDGLCQRAADEIERLREELAAYRARKPVVYSPDAQAMSDRVKAAEAERDELREENARLREGRMAEQEREELIEKMRTVLINARLMGFDYESAASAALAVAEPVIREQCARIAENFGNDVSASKYESSFSGKCVISASLDIAAAIREGGKDG